MYIFWLFSTSFFSGLAECTVSANNTQAANVMEPIRFEMKYS